MELKLWSNNHELYQVIQGSGKFNASLIQKETEIGSPEILVIDGNYVKIQDVILLEPALSEIGKVFFIMPPRMMNLDVEGIQSELPSVIFLAPRLTINQITEQIILSSHKDIILPERNIHVFFGADSKVGTTMTASSASEILAEQTDAKIGLLLLGSNPVHYFNGKSSEMSGLDSIKIKLFNGILTEEDLLKATIKTKRENLYVLSGPSNIQDIRYYQPEHAESLLTLAERCFDLVIVDAGCNVERGLCLGSVRMAHNRFLITTQQQHAKERFIRVSDQIFQPLQIDKQNFVGIVNKRVEGSITKKQIETTYGIKVISEIPYLDLKGWQAEIDQKTLLHYDQRYADEVKNVSRYIAETQKIPFRDVVQKGWKAKLSGWLK